MVKIVFFFSIEMEKYGRYVTYLFSIEFGGKIHLFTSSLFSRFGKEKKFKLIRHNTIQINPTLLTLKFTPLELAIPPSIMVNLYINNSRGAQ